MEADGFRALRLDVTDEGSMVSAVATVEAERGAVDVLVNNAGYALYGPVEELSWDAVRDEFEVNVFGMLRMSQLVLPGMGAKGAGRVVNVGSMGGLFTSPFAGAYHMSKYAIESLSDALRAEVAGFGVDVALLEPTGVRTPFIHKQLATAPDTGPDSPYAAQKAAGAAGALALFREGSRAVVDPEDVAKVVVEAATAPPPHPLRSGDGRAHHPRRAQDPPRPDLGPDGHAPVRLGSRAVRRVERARHVRVLNATGAGKPGSAVRYATLWPSWSEHWRIRGLRRLLRNPSPCLLWVLYASLRRRLRRRRA